MKMSRKTKEITMRHEEKFICSERELILLEARVRSLLPLDKHQRGSSYKIRSVYFDTAFDRMLHESLQGIERRSKFRIRTYDCSIESVHLEKKVSHGQLKSKQSCGLEYADVMGVLENKPIPEISAHSPGVLQEFTFLQNTELLTPKVIVEYDRAAYVEDIGNIRITFDRHICASSEIERFFEEELHTISILPEGVGVLEVKYDGMLPGYLSKALNMSSLHRVSFSKYGLCRNIIQNNGRIEEYYEF